MKRPRRSLSCTSEDEAVDGLNSGARQSKNPAKRNSNASDWESPQNVPSPQELSASDSDPLEALVGPLPHSVAQQYPAQISTDTAPISSRGRGAHRPGASTIDAHFLSAYKPSQDLQPELESEDEREDWDMALEAHRDRELWRRKGAERLRAAGFGEAEVKRWADTGAGSNSAEDRDIASVKWTGKGEAREWDLGKVFVHRDEAGDSAKKGDIKLEAAWKRQGGGFLKDFKKALG